MLISYHTTLTRVLAIELSRCIDHHHQKHYGSESALRARNCGQLRRTITLEQWRSSTNDPTRQKQGPTQRVVNYPKNCLERGG